MQNLSLPSFFAQALDARAQMMASLSFAGTANRIANIPAFTKLSVEVATTKVTSDEDNRRSKADTVQASSLSLIQKVQVRLLHNTIRVLNKIE